MYYEGWGNTFLIPLAYLIPTEEDMRTTGLCRYLSADGRALMDEPQNVWRLPTTDEYVRCARAIERFPARRGKRCPNYPT